MINSLALILLVIFEDPKISQCVGNRVAEIGKLFFNIVENYILEKRINVNDPLRQIKQIIKHEEAPFKYICLMFLKDRNNSKFVDQDYQFDVAYLKREQLDYLILPPTNLDNYDEKQISQSFTHELKPQRSSFNDDLIEPTGQVSDHLSDYNQFFQNLEKQNKLTNSSLYQPMFKDQNICYRKQSFREFNFIVIKNSINFQIIQAELEWGYFKIKINILNRYCQSFFHHCQSASGENGTVYFISKPGEPFAVKCITCDKKQNNTQIIRKAALKEYFISKICSVLKCGPKLGRYFGFDLVFSSNCIEFALQKCYPMTNRSLSILQTLKQSLFLLHHYNILHYDIKPNNIMFSRTFSKYVFIDFGLSQIFKQPFGYKHLLSFKGTPNFCSNQMALAFEKGCKSMIDPYYNDVFCLKETFKYCEFGEPLNLQQLTDFYGLIQIQRFQDKFCIDEQKNVESFKTADKQTLSPLSIILFKYSIYTGQEDIKQQITLWSSLNQQYIYKQILNFLHETNQITLSEYLYQQVIPSLIKESIEFQWLNRWMKSQFSMIQVQPSINSQKKSMILWFYDGIDKQNYIGNMLVHNFPDKSLFQQMCTDKNVIDKKQSFFYTFLQYISFINNLCGVNNFERLKAIQRFIMLIPQTIANDLIIEKIYEQQNIIFKELKKAYDIILNWYFKGCYKQKEFQPPQRFEIIFDIIEHYFYFNLISTQQIVLKLNQIYQLPFCKAEYKLELLLKVKHFNLWLLFIPPNQVKIDSKIIDNYWRDKIIALQKQQIQNPLNVLLNEIINDHKNWNDKISSIIEQQTLQIIPNSLRFQILLGKVIRQIQLVKFEQVNSRLKYFFSRIPFHLKSKSFPFYNQLFLKFSQFCLNEQDCKFIYSIFEKNINSSQLCSKLITYKLLGLSQSKTEDKIKWLLQITQIISNNNYKYFVEIITNTLYSIPNQSLSCSETNINYQQILTHNLCQFFRSVTFKVIVEGISQNCYDNICIYDYLLFKYHCSRKVKSLVSSYFHQIQQFQDYIKQQTDCKVCSFVLLSCQLRIGVISKVRATEKKTINERLDTFKALQSCFEIIGCQTKQYFSDIRYTNFILLILAMMDGSLIESSFQPLITGLFQIFKDNKVMHKYIGLILFRQQIIYYTLCILQQQNALNDVIFFIKSLLSECSITRHALYLNRLTDIITSYIKWSIKTSTSFASQVYNQIKQQNNTSTSVIFYQSYAIGTIYDSQREQCYLKVFQNLVFLPYSAVLFFTFGLLCSVYYTHSYYTANNRIRFKSGTNRNKEFVSIKPRKKEFVEKILLRILHKTQGLFMKYIQKGKKSVKLKKLYQKCYLFGGPYKNFYKNYSVFLSPRIKK